MSACLCMFGPITQKCLYVGELKAEVSSKSGSLLCRAVSCIIGLILLGKTISLQKPLWVPYVG